MIQPFSSSSNGDSTSISGAIYFSKVEYPLSLINSFSSLRWLLNGENKRGYEMKGIGIFSDGNEKFCGISVYPCSTIDCIKETKSFSSSSSNTISLSSNSFTQQ
jgi:hypothetical protein